MTPRNPAPGVTILSNASAQNSYLVAKMHVFHLSEILFLLHQKECANNSFHLL